MNNEHEKRPQTAPQGPMPLDPEAFQEWLTENPDNSDDVPAAPFENFEFGNM